MKGFDVDRYTFKIALIAEVSITVLFVCASFSGEAIPKIGNLGGWLLFSTLPPLAIYINYGSPSQVQGYYWLKYVSAASVTLFFLFFSYIWYLVF